MIYLDSSALLKLVFDEDESAALAGWIAEREGVPMISSELAKIEVVRATRRIASDAVPAARSLVAQLDLVPLSSPLIDAATDVGEPLLRSLDAIHLASALTIGSELTDFVVYDQRLAAAARGAGLRVAQPGG